MTWLKYRLEKRCRVCSVELTEKNWYDVNKRQFSYICKLCCDGYRKQFPSHNPNHPERISKRSLNFKKRRIILAENPRKGTCIKCGAKDRTTVMHHLEYDEKDPLAHTIEVCQSCHNKLHNVKFRTCAFCGKFVKTNSFICRGCVENFNFGGYL